jgi:D-glycero-alpha-D-manno-heptose-7-phosphate kinase
MREDVMRESVMRDTQIVNEVMSDMRTREAPFRVINAVAPIRICDNGGWTDTWFAGYGAIFNIGVSPYAEVQVEVYQDTGERPRAWLNVENYGDYYAVSLDEADWRRHPLLEASIRRMGVPEGVALEITTFSEAPSGASTGTSAAISVALIGALDCLTPGRLTPQEIATTAHLVETEMLGRQSGVQDQVCSAYGGINYIEVPEYPKAVVTPIKVPNELWWELERRLALVYLGKSHDSSQVHDKVIAGLENAGPGCKELEDLRMAAAKSYEAISAGDLSGLGMAMIENTEAQARLHPELVSQDARRVIEIAKKHEVVGWKVNGSGGEGGSLTLLCGSSAQTQRAMLREIQEESPLFKHIPIRLDRYGVRRWTGGKVPGTGDW